MPDYVFDPEVVHECALAALGKPKPAMFDAVADALEARYPGVLDRSQPWIYSIAGGAMIQMKLYERDPQGEHPLALVTPEAPGAAAVRASTCSSLRGAACGRQETPRGGSVDSKPHVERRSPGATRAARRYDGC